MHDTKVLKSKSENSDLNKSLFENYLEWFSPKDAAIYLRKFKDDGTPSVEAIYKLIQRKKLRATKWLRSWYIKKIDIDFLLESKMIY